MSSGPVARSRNRSKQLRKPQNLRRLPTCRRPVARGNFRRRQILFPRPSGGPSASSETRPRSPAGRDTRRHVSLRRGTRPKLPRRVPEVRSVANSGPRRSVFHSYHVFCVPRAKISKSFPRRYRGAQGRERPGGVRGRPLQRGTANATRRDCTDAHPSQASRLVAHWPAALQDQ